MMLTPYNDGDAIPLFVTDGLLRICQCPRVRKHPRLVFDLYVLTRICSPLSRGLLYLNWCRRRTSNFLVMTICLFRIAQPSTLTK